MTDVHTRDEYIMKCKHYCYSGQCLKKSGQAGPFHVTVSCDGDCERMKRYDRKQKKEGGEK